MSTPALLEKDHIFISLYSMRHKTKKKGMDVSVDVVLVEISDSHLVFSFA